MRKSMCLAFRNAGGFRIIWESARISRNETASTCSSLKYLRWFRDKNVLIYYCQGEYVIQTRSLVWEFLNKLIQALGASEWNLQGYPYPPHCSWAGLQKGIAAGAATLGNEMQQGEAGAPQWATSRPSLPQTSLLLASLNPDLITGHWRKSKIAREYIYIYENVFVCLKSVNKCITNKAQREFFK